MKERAERSPKFKLNFQVAANVLAADHVRSRAGTADSSNVSRRINNGKLIHRRQQP